MAKKRKHVKKKAKRMKRKTEAETNSQQAPAEIATTTPQPLSTPQTAETPALG